MGSNVRLWGGEAGNYGEFGEFGEFGESNEGRGPKIGISTNLMY